MALADGIYGRVSLTYAHTDSKSTDFTGLSSDFSSRAFLQQYSLTADNNIYPNLRLFASGLFQKVDTTTSTNGQGSWSDVTTVRPYIDLTLKTPVFSAGVNYNSVTTETTNLSAPNTTFKSESYGAILGWKPQDLPTLDMTLTRTYNYDVTRTIEDNTADQLNVYSTYSPTRTVQLRYQGSWIDSKDNLKDLENKTLANDIRVMYNDQYLHDRVGVSTYYDYNRANTDIITGGQGTVKFQIFAVNGLFLSSDIPLTVTLPPAPFLTDNVFTGPTSEVNNIGSGTFAVAPPDTTARNIGLQFAIATGINTLDIVVFSVTGATVDTAVPAFLPSAVAQAFTWAVYTSSDNLNWQLFQTGAPAPYTVNASSPGVGTFELTFPTVTAKFIKVVVSPLSPAAAGGQSRDFPGIYVTELQAFISRPAASVEGYSSSTNESGSLNTRVLLLKTPGLTYNFTYFFNDQQSQFSTTRTATMSNQLAIIHQFSPALFGSAQAQRIDEYPPGGGDSVTLQTGGQITAVPLRTLTHTLGFSVSTQQLYPIGRTNNEALTLTNTAELYRNITAFLNGGLSTSTTSIPELRTDSANYNLGLNMIPIETLNITFSAGGARTDQWGSNNTTLTQSSRSRELDVSYYPVRALYLFASWIVRYTTGAATQRLQNYGINWSPFQGGDLTFNFSYTESLNSLNNSIDKTWIPSARWNITRRTYATISYNSDRSSSNLGETTTRTYAASLSMNF